MCDKSPVPYGCKVGLHISRRWVVVCESFLRNKSDRKTIGKLIVQEGTCTGCGHKVLEKTIAAIL